MRRCPPPDLQDASEQRPHKLSYHLQARGADADQAIDQLKGKLAEAGVDAKVIYSGGVDVDILAAKASKGKGLEFLLQQVRLHIAQMEIVCVPTIICMMSLPRRTD